MTHLLLLQSLIILDIRNIQRDVMLRWMIFLPFVVALAMRGVVPLLLTQLTPHLPIDITPYYPTFMGSALILIIPTLCGTVIGFLLLDQKDDGTLQALQVTPLPLTSYLFCRLLLPVGLSIGVTLVTFPLANLLPIRTFSLFWITLAAAPLAPLSTLFLATFASNKVQGLALVKLATAFMMPALAAYFVPSPWQWLFALFPTYWPARLLWQNQTGGSEAWLLLVGILYQSTLVWLLIKQFNQKMGR